jgi:hypothetical protein
MANHRNPPHETGPSAKPEKRGGGPSGSGWLVARVPVAWSTITIGPQSDTPQPARVSLADRLGFLEIALSELWLVLLPANACSPVLHWGHPAAVTSTSPARTPQWAADGVQFE